MGDSQASCTAVASICGASCGAAMASTDFQSPLPPMICGAKKTTIPSKTTITKSREPSQNIRDRGRPLLFPLRGASARRWSCGGKLVLAIDWPSSVHATSVSEATEIVRADKLHNLGQLPAKNDFARINWALFRQISSPRTESTHAAYGFAARR